MIGIDDVPIHRLVRIQTKSYRDSIKTLRLRQSDSARTPRTPRFLHVDVSGLNTDIESTANLKVLALDATEISDYQPEYNSFATKHLLLKFTGFPDDESSKPHTDSLIRFVYDVFCHMENCSNIIINCRQGKNRCIMLGSRISAFIQHGINKPSREAYGFYQQFCKSVSDGYNESDYSSWPKLCNNDFVQDMICGFNRGDGPKFPAAGRGFHVGEDPRGNVYCAHYAELLSNSVSTNIFGGGVYQSKF